jgi:hypothetical protein
MASSGVASFVSARLKQNLEVTENYRTMDNSESIGVYGEAKAEYTRQLCSFLVPALETYFLDLLAEVKTTEKDPKRFLWAFQDALKQFPDWNIDKVQRETEKVQASTKCDYLEEILTAVFIAHTKVLSAIRLTSRQKKLQITIPKIDHFLHRTMSECARLLWSNAYLFSESGTAIERQKNLRQVEQLLHEGVLQSIRGMLPVKSILKEYLADDTEETPAEQAAAEQAVESGTQEDDTAPVIHEESIQPTEAKEEDESKETPAVEESVSEVAPPPAPTASMTILTTSVLETVDVSGAITPNTLPPPPPPTPTIVVDTEPPSVGFTSMDAVLDVENPDGTRIQATSQFENDEEQEEVTHIEFDETEPAEPLDDFETLELAQETIAVRPDEFETL